MGNNWIQKIGLKVLGLPMSALSATSTQLINLQTQAIQRFNQVISNQIGVMAWNDNSYKGNVNGYSSNGTIYTIIKRIAETAAIAPFKVYKIKDKVKHKEYLRLTGEKTNLKNLQKAYKLKEFVYEEDNNHPLNELIEAPNDYQSGEDFVISSISFKLLTGNRFVYQNILEEGADAGLPAEIYNLPPQYMAVVSDGTLYGVSKYKFSLGKEEVIEKESIIHSKYFNPEFDTNGSHLLGMSPLKPANKNATRSDAAVERSTSYLKNAGSPGALVNEEGTDDTQEQADALRDKVNERIRGKGNAGKVSLLNGKWNYLNFGMTSGEMEVLDTEKYTNQQLCNIYSFPPGLLDPDKSGEHNATEFKKELLTGACIPALSGVRADWQVIAKHYKDKNIYVDYDISVYPELQEDQEKTAKIMAAAWWYTGNEKRLAMGQDEDNAEPMMNTYLIPSGLVPIAHVSDAMLDMMDQLDNAMNEPDDEQGTIQ